MWRVVLTTALLAPAAAMAQDVGDAGVSDAAMDAAPPAPIVPTYYKDDTDLSFPTPTCADPTDPDAIGCYTNWLVLSDIESDGDLDILFANGGGYYVPGSAEDSQIYVNDGKGAFRDGTQALFAGAKSRLRQVAVGDVDGDGDRDVYMPGGYGIDLDKLFIQDKGKFVDQAATNLPKSIEVDDAGVPVLNDAGVVPSLMSRAGSAHLGDLDGDGDLDLVIGDWGATPRRTIANTRIYFNDGKGVFTAAALDIVPPTIPFSQPANPDGGVAEPIYWGVAPIDIDTTDVDNDFDLDILINHRNGQSRIFINDGKGKFTDGTIGKYPKKNGPYVYNVEACDFDEDGDLDLLLDNAGGVIPRAPKDQPPNPLAGDLTQVLVNDGTGTFTDQTTALIKGEPGGDDNAVKCADINGDGHYDLVVASLTTMGEKLLLNDGKGLFNFVPNAFPLIEDPTLGIDAADLNGDGLIDFVTGQGEGAPRIDRLYLGTGLSKKDVTPPKFRKIEKPMGVPGKATIVRFAVTDSVTSETGEHVKDVGIEYTINGGALLTAPATFVGGDIFRVELPAQADGTVLKLTPTATDRAGLTGKGASFEIVVGMLMPDAGAPITPGMTGMDAGVGGGVDSGVVVTPEDPRDDSKDDDDGCSVSSGNAGVGSSGIFFMLGLALLAVRRTRLSRTLRGSSNEV
jgi:MYXO-CTERM domain-containing protein